MSVTDISLLVVALFFSLYGVLTSLETGVAILRLWPKLSVNPKATLKLFTPWWEVTNVFLVFGFTAFAMLFNNALPILSPKLLPVLAVAMVALIVRASLAIYFYYHTNTNFGKILNLLFLIANVAIPLSFAAVGIYLLSGQYFWLIPAGWLMMGASVAGLIVIGLSFSNRYLEVNQPLLQRNLLTWLFAAWVSLLSLGVLQLTHTELWSSYAPVILESLLVITSAIYIVLLNKRLLHRAWILIALTSYIAPLLLAWANRPYLAANLISLDQAFGAKAYANALLIGLVISLPLVILGFYLLIRLLKPQAPADSSHLADS